MAASFGWGALAASSLVIGAIVALRFHLSLRVIGLIMGFGAGVLISALSSISSTRRSRSHRETVGSRRACSPAVRSSSAATS